jgi:hypothetical protein
MNGTNAVISKLSHNGIKFLNNDYSTRSKKNTSINKHFKHLEAIGLLEKRGGATKKKRYYITNQLAFNNIYLHFCFYKNPSHTL